MARDQARQTLAFSESSGRRYSAVDAGGVHDPDLADNVRVIFEASTSPSPAPGRGVRRQHCMGTEDAAILFAICDRKVVKLVNHWDRERALADLGIEE